MQGDDESDDRRQSRGLDQHCRNGGITFRRPGMIGAGHTRMIKDSSDNQEGEDDVQPDGQGEVDRADGQIVADVEQPRTPG